MDRKSVKLSAIIVACATFAADSRGDTLEGHYIEARTCQVYTGPCFANGEFGLTGKDAVMAWSIHRGKQAGVDLAGLNVVVLVRTSDTLAFAGMRDADEARSVILVDRTADHAQRQALVEFAKQQAGKAGEQVEAVSSVAIDFELDIAKLTGQVSAGKEVQLRTRQARPGDCICSNESAYYPPLANVDHFAPGVTLEGRVTARALGSRWSIPDSRTSYMATFKYE